MRQITGSSLDQAESCPASHALPCIKEQVGEAAKYGTAIHSYLETDVIPKGYEDACKAIDLEAARPAAKAEYREVTYTWCPETGEVKRLGTGLNRDYSKAKAGSIPITLDRVWQDASGTWHVDDYKTGQFPPSAETLQGGLGVVCVAKDKDVDSVEFAVVHVPENDIVRRYTKAYDFFDIEDMVARLWKLVENVKASRAMVESGTVPDVSTGQHCQYCPAMASCPAHAGLARRMLDADDMLKAIDTMTIEKVSEAYIMAQQAESMVTRIKAACKARVVQNNKPVCLKDGRFLKVRKTTRRPIVVDKARAVFEEHGVSPRIRESISIEAIGAVAKDRKHLNEILKDLHDAGAIAYNTSTSLVVSKG